MLQEMKYINHFVESRKAEQESEGRKKKTQEKASMNMPVH